MLGELGSGGKSTLGRYIAWKWGGQYIDHMPSERNFAHIYDENARVLVIDIARADKTCRFDTIERVKGRPTRIFHLESMKKRKHILKTTINSSKFLFVLGCVF